MRVCQGMADPIGAIAGIPCACFQQIQIQDNTPGKFDFPTTLKSFLVPFAPAKSAIVCTPPHLPERIAGLLSIQTTLGRAALLQNANHLFTHKLKGTRYSK